MKKIITVLMILAAMSMLLSGLTLTAENTADEPEPERKVSVSKEVFDEGEAIIVTASGLSTDYVVFYPVGYVPGKDAGVYYACFDTSVSNRGDWYQVENGVPSDVFDWCCATPQNPQVVPYIDIPEGEYKVVLRDNSGKVIDQVDVAENIYGNESGEGQRVALSQSKYGKYVRMKLLFYGNFFRLENLAMGGRGSRQDREDSLRLSLQGWSPASEAVT